MCRPLASRCAAIVRFRYLQLSTPARLYSICAAAAQSSTSATDWSAAQYLKFSDQRTRPSRDLLAQIPISSPRRILDVGCGPGNSTAVLVKRYPDAKVTGIDSSPNMIETAKKSSLPNMDFAVADLVTYVPEQPMDVIFSNAVFHWVRREDRLPTMKRFIESLNPGGVFAMQVPDNFSEDSHAAMRVIADSGPWAETLRRLQPSYGQFQTTRELYDGLVSVCSSLDIWHTLYQHPLENHQEIVEWVKGSGLRPFIEPLQPLERRAFLEKYLQSIKELYPTATDGKVLLRYPRLFLVAVKA